MPQTTQARLSFGRPAKRSCVMFVIKLPNESIEIIWPRTFSSTTSGLGMSKCAKCPTGGPELPRIKAQAQPRSHRGHDVAAVECVGDLRQPVFAPR